MLGKRLTRWSRLTPDHDLALQLPINFAGLLFKFSSGFDCDAVTILLRKRGFDIELQTAGQTVVVNFNIVLGRTERYQLYDLTNRALAGGGIFPFHVSPKDMVRALELVKTGCDSVRIIVGSKPDRVLVEGGTMRAPSEVGQPAAKKAKKAPAIQPTESSIEKVWDSPADATVKKVERSADGTVLPPNPFDQVVVRVDALYLSQKLGKVISAYGKDLVDVTLKFNGYKCKRHPKTGEILPEGTTVIKTEEVQADEDENEWVMEEREVAAAAKMKPPTSVEAGQQQLVPYDSWQPTSMTFSFTSASSDMDSSVTFALVDRTDDYKQAADNHRNAKRPAEPEPGAERHIDWENNEFDVNNPLGDRSDFSLGLFNVNATVAELLAFPRDITDAPEPWSYSGRHLKLALGGSDFSRRATFHINAADEIAARIGVLWVCFPIDEGRAGMLHSLVGRLADIA